jgi:general stress protein 26
MAAPRNRETRKADTLAILSAIHRDAWVATASRDGAAHLVPLSYSWDGEQLVLATERDTPTLRNLEATGRARVGVGDTRDVVMIDATLTAVIDASTAPAAIGDAYVAQADWDPRGLGDPMVYVTLRPVRIQAWREANEIAGRTLMRDSLWLV